MVHPALVTYCLKNRAGCPRIGITASKKIGNAPQRNRARRVIRAAWRTLDLPLTRPIDVVFVARARTTQIKSTALLPIMAAHLRKLGLSPAGSDTP